jgi:hypothetical protein
LGFEDEEEDLADVVVTLEVMQIRLSSKDFSDEVRELFLPLADLFRGLVCLIVNSL